MTEAIKVRCSHVEVIYALRLVRGHGVMTLSNQVTESSMEMEEWKQTTVFGLQLHFRTKVNIALS